MGRPQRLQITKKFWLKKCRYTYFLRSASKLTAAAPQTSTSLPKTCYSVRGGIADIKTEAAFRQPLFINEKQVLFIFLLRRLSVFASGQQGLRCHRASLSPL